MSNKEFKALEEKVIEVGDVVRTDYRGGVRQGTVKEIATEKDQHPHPPKVVFDRERPGQQAKEVAHNPSTLEKGELEMANRACPLVVVFSLTTMNDACNVQKYPILGMYDPFAVESH